MATPKGSAVKKAAAKPAAAPAPTPAKAKRTRAAAPKTNPLPSTEPNPPKAPALKDGEVGDCILKFQVTGNIVRASYEALGAARKSVDIDVKDLAPALSALIREIKAAS